MASWLGLDVGTSSVKAVLVADDGAVLGSGSAAYPTHRAADAVAEQDPCDYLTACSQAVAQCGTEVRSVTAVGLAGQTPTVVLCDAAGQPARPALTWQDQRATAEAGRLATELGDPFWHLGTSLPWSAAGLPAKLAWLAAHEPQALSASTWILQPKDFVGLALTGSPLSDPWSAKGLRHVGTGEVCADLLAAAGVPARLAPPVAAPWQVRGEVRSPELGLPPGAAVTVGWSDALAGMLAVGAFDAPSAFALTGTSDITGITVDAGPVNAGQLYCVPASCAPRTVIYGPTSTSGAALVWLADLLQITVRELLDLAAGAHGGPPPAFVPYLEGERAPIWRHDICAVFSGLRRDTTRADLARAVLTGVACSERHVIDTALQLAGAAPGPWLLAGGRSGSHPSWQQARAQVFGRDIHAFDTDALTAIGAAALAAGAGSGERAVAAAGRLRGKPVVAPGMSDDGSYQRYLASSAHALAIA